MSSISHEMDNDSSDIISGSERDDMEVSGELMDLHECEKRRNSWKWINFITVAGRVTCKICNKSFSLKTSTSILKRHASQHTNTDSADPDASIASTSSCSPRGRIISLLGKQKCGMKHSDYDTLLKNFVIHGNHSLHIVEEEHFQKLISALNGNYILPSRYTLTKGIQNLFKDKKHEVINLIKSSKYKLSLTFDFWTSVTNKPYIVVTAHFMTREGKLMSMIIEFDLIPYPHKSEQVLQKLFKYFPITL
jgi:hypothetical protein